MKVYALEVESLIYTVLSWLIGLDHDTCEDVQADVPEILIGITLL